MLSIGNLGALRRRPLPSRGERLEEDHTSGHAKRFEQHDATESGALKLSSQEGIREEPEGHDRAGCGQGFSRSAVKIS